MKKKWLGVLCFLVIGMPPLVISTAVQLENHDSFCASCHTEPESVYYERSFAEPTDLASSHASGVRCIDCHSGPGTAGRLAALQQGTADLLRYVTGAFSQPAETHHPLGDAGCTQCHPVLGSAPFSSQHYHQSRYLLEFQVRQPTAAGICNACHPSHLPGGKAFNYFLDHLFVNQTCEACHTALSGWVPTE